MSKNRKNNAEVLDSCTTRLNALKQYVSSTKATIAIDGETHKVSDVIAMYQACLDTRAALTTQRAQVKATLVSRAIAEATRRAADRALKPWVINQYGAGSQQAHDFGFPPPKAPVRTVEEKSQAVARNHATRDARHTMGPKQKKGIKGTTIAPAAPADPAAPVAQAAAAPQPAPVTTPANGVATSAVNGTAAH
jgi:hypothetical protein